MTSPHWQHRQLQQQHEAPPLMMESQSQYHHHQQQQQPHLPKRQSEPIGTSASKMHPPTASAASSATTTTRAAAYRTAKQHSPHHPMCRRTRSLDDEGGRGRRRGTTDNPSDNENNDRMDHDQKDNRAADAAEEQEQDDTNQSTPSRARAQQPLHSSFDASLLESDLNSIFRVTSKRSSSATAASSASSIHLKSGYEVKTPHSSGRKHLRQPRATPSFHNNDEEEEEDDELICPGTVRKLARHNSNDSSKSRGTPVRPLHWYTTSRNHNPLRTVLKAPRAAAFHPPLTPRSTATTQPPTTARRFSMDTLETDSPNSHTPFRFTTFPASLPRVHPPMRSGAYVPDSVRKRMFVPPPAAAASSSAALNHSREEEGTQNTSISSLSTHGGCDDDEQHDQRMPAVHTRLFLEEDYAYSDDDDDDDDIDIEVDDDDNVGRTRLDFNLAVLSPKNLEPSKSTLREGGALAGLAKRKGMLQMRLDSDMDHDDDEYQNEQNADLSRPYEAKHVHSFPSVDTTSTAGLTGSGGLEHAAQNHDSLLDHEGPTTPREVQLHFPFNEDQCSPIPGIPEEEELPPRPVLRMRRPSCSGGLPPKPNPPADAPRAALSTQLKSGSSHSKDGVHTEEARHSFSAAESVSSTTSSKMRRRPMPDMSAFEAESAASKNGHDRSVDEMSGDTTHYPGPSSPKLLCPPTPVRTPAWAHVNDTPSANVGGGTGTFHRTNSLIMSRVLATCSDAGPPEEAKIEATLAPNQEMTNGDATALLSGKVSAISEDAKLPPKDAITAAHGEVISFSTDFESLGILGRGAFADVFKVRSKTDNRLYAVKRNRRHFRGKRDRDIALAEVRSMQRLQRQNQQKNKSLQYLLFFYRAWQEDGHFFCQTELCCRDTCRELIDSLRSQWNVAKTRYPSLIRNLPAPEGVLAGGAFDVAGRLVPETSVFKICHDIAAGLSHIHICGLVHNDIKPSNIFFVAHPELGCLCKIGDFGMAGMIGTSEDGQEGDQKYMAAELLSSGVKHASADIFSLGLTLYELASDLTFELPKGGPRWHELRDGKQFPDLPASRGAELGELIHQMICPAQEKRPTAQSIVAKNKVQLAGSTCDVFLREYIRDLQEFDQREEELRAATERVAEDQTPRTGTNGAPCRARMCSPTFGQFPTTSAAALFSPGAQAS